MRLTRRSFVLDGLRITALVPLAPRLALAANCRSSRSRGERVLVVVQLTGGNDGLNTVVPHRQDAYFRMRPSIALARGALHALDDDHGLHPEMGALAEVFGAGELAVVHGVGTPVPDRSHFRSLEMWHTADPFAPAGEPAREIGWLGRLADQIAGADPEGTPALSIGGGDLPLSMRGERFLAPTVRDFEGFRLHEASASFARERDALLDAPGAGDLAFLRAAARTTYAAARRMSEISAREEGSGYPESELARELKLVASLVAGDFGTRIFHLSLAGFDTHARQAPVHANLVQQLSAALAAFQHDLARKGIGERVVTFVFSEFGRRAAENGSKGTDHGRGAPVFLMGAPVEGGMHGTPPDLEDLVEGDVRQTADFRGVYALLEAGWMGLEPSTAETAMPLLKG